MDVGTDMVLLALVSVGGNVWVLVGKEVTVDGVSVAVLVSPV
jgi:hypothetical protein